MKTVTATAYLTIEPEWRGNRLAGARVAKVTQTKPNTGPVGAAVVRLTVEVPERVFRPYEVDALVTAQLGDVGQVRVAVTPFEEREQSEHAE